MQFLKNQKGFSFIEVIVVVGILVILMGVVTMNLVSAARQTYQDTTASTLYADLKTQQIKAMNGDTEGSGTTGNYGVYFQPTQYILFRGSTYPPSNPTNFTVKISDNANFTNILFPNSQIIFASGSGEFTNFVSGKNSITITNTAGLTQKTVTLNRFGVVTSN